jgi:hypothetical protein
MNTDLGYPIEISAKGCTLQRTVWAATGTTAPRDLNVII